jgi:hypothetical protein
LLHHQHQRRPLGVVQARPGHGRVSLKPRELPRWRGQRPASSQASNSDRPVTDPSIMLRLARSRIVETSGCSRARSRQERWLLEL